MLNLSLQYCSPLQHSVNHADSIKLQFLEDLELLDDGYVIPRLSPEDSLSDVLPDELLLLLKTLALSPEQLKQQQSKNKPSKPSFGQAELTILHKAIQLTCAQYATNIQQDQELLAQLNASNVSAPLHESPRRHKMAIMVRIGEKEILQDLDCLLSESIQSGDAGSAVKRSANDDQGESRKAKAQRT